MKNGDDVHAVKHQKELEDSIKLILPMEQDRIMFILKMEVHWIKMALGKKESMN